MTVRIDFQAAALFTDTYPRSRGAMRPSFCKKPFAQENRGRRECRVPNAPAASRAKYEKHTSVVTTVTPDPTRHSPRNGFNSLYRALPGERILVVTVTGGLKADQTRSSLISPPPAWHQQRVSEPHGFAVRSSADHLAR
jgi:hypothetical protein